MIQQLGILGNMYISKQVATGANANTEASAFSFVLEVEKGDSILSTPDELNTGATLTGTNAMSRAIARALVENRTINWGVFDPTTSAAPGNTTATSRVGGQRIVAVQVGNPYNSLTTAGSSITITKIV